MNDGWIEWNGGECPIKSGKTRGVVQLRSGQINGLNVGRWKWVGVDPSFEIIAYRITENHEPPYYAPIDMAQNRVPWVLLTDEEREAIKAWALSFGAVYRWHSGNRKWVGADLSILGVALDAIYRTVAPTVITEERQDISTNAGHLVTVTLTLHDGKPISGTVAV